MAHLFAESLLACVLSYMSTSGNLFYSLLQTCIKGPGVSRSVPRDRWHHVSLTVVEERPSSNCLWAMITRKRDILGLQ